MDPRHTEVGFSVKHFFTPVTGKLEEFDATLRYYAEQPEESAVNVTIRSTSVREAGPNQLVATGPLTIKAVTREVELPIDVLGIQDIPPQMQVMLDGATQVALYRAGRSCVWSGW